MVTGCSSGIGKATALGLAKLGATVVMVCRDKTRGERAKSEIIAKSGNSSVSLMLADLSSQRAIRDLVIEYSSRFKYLHVLVNNAGLFLSKRRLTEDNIEMTFAVNHLAPFLLTNLLLPILKASAPSRIVNVSSVAHFSASIDFDDLQGKKHYSGFKAYARSKLANVLFTYELARRLEGTNVAVNCLHPGVVRTGLARGSMSLMRLAYLLFAPFMLSPKKGARTSIYLASSPKVVNVTGKYFVKERDVKSSEESYNEDVAKKLWDISIELTQYAV